MTIFFALIISVFSHARSDEYRIFTGGQFAATLLNRQKAKLEAIADAKLDIRVTPAAFTYKFLLDGVAIGIVQSKPLDVLLANASEKEKAGAKEEDLESVNFTDSEVKIGLHPENPVKQLKKEQIIKILKGEVKSWTELGGEDVPVQLIFAKTANATMPIVYRYYLKEAKYPLPEIVEDAKGLLRAMEKNKGVISFFTSLEYSDAITPKFIETGITRPSYFIISKNGPAPARRLFEQFKKQKLDNSLAWSK